MKNKIIRGRMNLISSLLLFYDIFAVNLTYLIALWLRFDCEYSSIPMRYLDPAFRIIPLHTLIMLIALASLRLYQSVWRYASLPEMIRVFVSSLISVGAQCAGTLILYRRMPISYYFIGWLLTFGALVVSRFGYRAFRIFIEREIKSSKKEKM